MKRIFYIILFFLFSSFHAQAAPKSQLWSFWDQADQSNQTQISHQDWQDILDQYLVVQGEDNLVKYKAFSNADKQKLAQYIQSLSQLDPREYNKKEQYAYWVNLYNALTVKVILDNYPIQSITKIGGVFSFGPWDEKLVTIAGKKITLNDIEHRILRPIWKDPRTHYAVNCASLGCPNLQTQAFTSQNTEKLLSQAENRFISSNKGVEIKEDSAEVSSIYEWFANDFGGKDKTWQYLQAKRPELKAIKSKPSYRYNWDLNEAK